MKSKDIIKQIEIATYRGAVIYRLNSPDEVEGQLLSIKLKAEGKYPEQLNMKADFFAEEANEAKTLKIIKHKIDRYLDQHEIEEFILEHPNQ